LLRRGGDTNGLDFHSNSSGYDWLVWFYGGEFGKREFILWKV